MRHWILLLTAAALVACQSETPAPTEAAAPSSTEETAPAADAGPATEAGLAESTLAEVLAAQPEMVQARYQFRHPQETIEFFGIEPGMTVVEGLPGGGWYTKILAPYLGTDGHIIAVNYPLEMWPLFPFGNEAFVARMRTWPTDFVADAEEWRDENSASISAHEFGRIPDELAGTADVVFFARVLHNLANFENARRGEYLSTALADVYTLLKPGGTFGVVQHHARDDMSDEFASGSHGYLKKSFVIARAEAAGFEFLGESDINANPNDLPGEDDVVWRLPPSYNGTGDDPELKAAVDAIGESNRMTLKFRKPSS